MAASQNAPQEERTATAIMIFAVVSAVAVLGVIIAFTLLAVSALLRGDTARGSAPYRVDNRPLPNATSPWALFPETLGRFRRESVIGTIQNFHVVYSGGEDRLVIAGSQAVSVAAALAGVRQVYNTAGPANVAQQIDDIALRYSYYLKVTDAAVRFAWSHDRWFFDIQASSKSALDDFMSVFEY